MHTLQIFVELAVKILAWQQDSLLCPGSLFGELLMTALHNFSQGQTHGLPAPIPKIDFLPLNFLRLCPPLAFPFLSHAKLEYVSSPKPRKM